MKKKILTSNVDVDIVGISRKLWNSKFLILSITILFSIFGFLSFKLLVSDERYYSASLTVKYPDKELFQNNGILLDYDRYTEIFERYAKSDLYLGEFIKQSQKIDNFKSWLEINNFSGKEYIRENLSSTFVKNQGLNLILSFPFDAEGGIFLREYILHIKEKSLRKFFELNKYVLNNRIETYQHNLIIAESIELNNPLIFQEKKNTEKNTQLINEPKALFYLGSKVLKIELERFKTYKNPKIIELTDYDPIVDLVTMALVFKKKKLLLYTLIGSIIGLCISIFIIFINITLVRQKSLKN